MAIELYGLVISHRATGIRFTVRVKPRASRSAILGVREGMLDVAIAAPPVDGEANKELVRVLAEAFGVPKRDVTIVSGESSKKKIVEITGSQLQEDIDDAIEANGRLKKPRRPLREISRK